MIAHRDNLTKLNQSVGFVPTMGALHSGHLSLVKKSSDLNNTTIVSIFVNPSQFSKGEDLDKYPRQLEADLALLRSIGGVDCVFAPDEKEMYPGNALCHVEPSDFSAICEGQARPDFFRGVATIVCKLFNIVRPTASYFGQKDISQCILLQRMVRDLNMQVAVRVCATLRESDGLAMSSRNVYLSPSERAVAPVLFKALNEAKLFCETSGRVVTRPEVQARVNAVLATEPQVSQVEYVSFASHENMKEVDKFDFAAGGGAVLSSAIRIGKVRLIDNVLIGSAHSAISN